MFRLLGILVARHWPWLLAVWGLVLALCWLLAPSWDSVTPVGEIRFLPTDAPSVRADRLYRQAFPLAYSPSNVVLVFSREDGPLRREDFDFFKTRLIKALGPIGAKEDSPVAMVRTPAEPKAGALLVSAGKQAALVLIELNTPIQDPRNVGVIGDIEQVLAHLRADGKIPAGLAVALSGSATAGRDLNRAEAASIRDIEKWTIILVVGMLVLLYRAPIAALIPLVTVFVAVAVAISVMASLVAAAGFTVARDLRVFITVLAYGAGVDYCVFLIARFREELDAGFESGEAISRAISQVGGAITASAGTVIFGIGMLYFAEFSKIHQAGLVIPLAIAVALLGTLTFGAALLAFTGRWAFWPLHNSKGGAVASPWALARWFRWAVLPDFWEKVGHLLLRRPVGVWLGTTLAMTPFVVVAFLHLAEVNFNLLSDLPPEAPSGLGTIALEKHFPAGAMASIVILVESERLDFTSDAGIAPIARLSERLLERKDALALADVRSIAIPLGTSAGAKERMAQITGSKEAVEKTVREEGMDYYVSRETGLEKHLTRLELTLALNPLSQNGIESLERIEKELPSLLPAELLDAQIAIAGATASLRDLSDIKRRDENLIQVLVPVVVLLLLWFLFRRIVLSVYLILSVLFSYYATLGLAYLVFGYIYGAEFAGLDWKVTIFLFTILVAVGEDYNIFLLARVKEEQIKHGPLTAIPIAMARTGTVISSCGFIMAGTFASLLSGSLRALKELGFALAVGVLLDTLVVRPILVPAFLVLLQRLFPGRLGQSMALAEPETDAKPSSSVS